MPKPNEGLKSPSNPNYNIIHKGAFTMKKFITFIIAIFDLMGSAMIADMEAPAEKSDRLCGIDRI